MSPEASRKKRENQETFPPAANDVADRGLIFVVQKHAASHLHYDFRLEIDGVLKSWAIPKGPSLDPSLKRLAMHVEDHPYDYKDFEGVIPPGNYGAGRVIIWDQGTYHAPGTENRGESEAALRKGYLKGDLKFVLHGRKLQGEFALVKIKSDDDKSWLLIKKQDRFATQAEVTRDERSVVSGATLESTVRRESAPAPQPRRASPSPLVAPDPMPHGVEPMLATSVDKPFSDRNWVFEIKLDGFRSIAEIEQGTVSLYSRNKLSFNQKFAPIAAALEGLGHDAVLDGEVVVLDDQGRSSFQLLQNYQRTGLGNLVYFAFDLLFLDGKNLCDLPLAKRKETLQSMLSDLPNIRYGDHIAEDGLSFYELARSSNLEGIVAKKSDSSYLCGKRSKQWLKIKIRLQQEAVICGYTEPRGSRKYFGALVLGAYQPNELTYIGLCGGGFDDMLLKEIHGMLQPKIRPNFPFKEKPPIGAHITWVHPSLVCEVGFAEWTDQRIMRQPIFLGMREDKPAETVVREAPLPATAVVEEAGSEQSALRSVPQKGSRAREAELFVNGKRIKLSNLDKVFWPEEGYTKRDVIEYYQKVAPFILPHLKDRPEALYRTPEGISKQGFFQKEAGELPPEWVSTKEIYSKSQDKMIKFFLCQDEATLIYMANLGCVELNPWLSHLPTLDRPDYFVIDLDPEDIAYNQVVEAALAVREILLKAGAPSFPKTSGSRGMHIYVPLAARYDYETAGRFAELVASMAHARAPGFTSLVRSPGKRQHKVYFDFLQNKAGQTIAAPYSLRVRPKATVSTPLTWDEVRPGLDPRAFTIETVHDRLKQMGDLFQGALGDGIDLEAALEKLQS